MITVVSLEIRAEPNVDTFFGTNMVVLISEVTLFQRCPLRGFPLRVQAVSFNIPKLLI